MRCPHCGRPTSDLTFDPEGTRWACPCGGQGTEDQLERDPEVDVTWLEVGEVLLDRDRATREGHLWTTREQIEQAIARVEWVEPDAGRIEGAMSPVLGIQAAIEQLDLHGVVAYSIDGYVTAWCDAEHATSAYSLYGIRNRYANGVADIFVVDRGTDLLPVRADFFPAVPA